MSVSNLEQNKTVKDALKSIVTEVVEEDETSFNFGGQLTFSETDILDLPKKLQRYEVDMKNGLCKCPKGALKGQSTR